MKRLAACGLLWLGMVPGVSAEVSSSRYQSEAAHTLAKRRAHRYVDQSYARAMLDRQIAIGLNRIIAEDNAAVQARWNYINSIGVVSGGPGGGGSSYHVGPHGGIWHYNSHGNKSYYRGK